MVNNYLKAVARVKGPNDQAGHIVRVSFIPFNDHDPADCARANRDLEDTCDGFEKAGYMTSTSIWSPCPYGFVCKSPSAGKANLPTPIGEVP